MDHCVSRQGYKYEKILLVFGRRGGIFCFGSSDILPVEILIFTEAEGGRGGYGSFGAGVGGDQERERCNLQI